MIETMFAATYVQKTRYEADPIRLTRSFRREMVYALEVDIKDATFQGVIDKIKDQYQLEVEDLCPIPNEYKDNDMVAAIVFERFEKDNGKEIVYDEEKAKKGCYMDNFYVARYVFDVQKRITDLVRVDEMFSKNWIDKTWKLDPQPTS